VTSDQTVRIAAASNIEKAFEEIGKAFTSKTGIRAEYAFQSSGMLERQIEEGAPYFVFASANEEFVDKAIATGKCSAASKTPFARGRLVALSAKGTRPPKSLADLADPVYSRIAIANPETAPYGAAARTALQRSGIWDRVQDKLVIGDNIESAMQFVTTGNATVGLVAQSLVSADAGGESVVVDPSLYDPLDEYLVTCGSGPELERAKAFVAFLGSPDGREIITRYGFAVPTR
jgi:molybdate transport system substrate-binding protein